MNTGIERRYHPRIPLIWPVILMTHHGPITGVTSNISEGGALILCSETIESDDVFQISLKSSKLHEMQITCEKVRSEKILVGNSDYNVNGIHFTEIFSSDKDIIASLIENTI